jgi:hypothetical protein
MPISSTMRLFAIRFVRWLFEMQRIKADRMSPPCSAGGRHVREHVDAGEHRVGRRIWSWFRRAD